MQNKRKKILMVVFYPIDFDGRVQRAAEALAEKFDVTVFSIDSGLHYFNKKFISKVAAVPNIRRFKLLQHIYFMVMLCITAIKMRPDIVHAHDFFMAFSGWLAARLTGAKLVYDAHELIIPEVWKKQSLRDRFWYLIELWAVRHAKLVIAANQERAWLMKAHYLLKEIPVSIRNIPPFSKTIISDEELFKLYPILRKKSEGKILLVYQGDVSLDRGVADFVRAMRYLNERFMLLIVGGGPDMERLRCIVKEDGLEESTVLVGKVPMSHLYDILRMCDIGIVTYPQKGLNNIYCAPNKTYEYAQAGLPLIMTNQPPLQTIAKKYAIGIAVPRLSDLSSNEKYYRDIASAVASIAENRVNYHKRLERFLGDNQWKNEQTILIEAVLDILIYDK